MKSTPDTLQSSQTSVIENPKSDYIKASKEIQTLISEEKKDNMQIFAELKTSGLDTQLIVKFLKETKDQPLAIRQTASQIYIDLLAQYPDYPKMSFSFKSGIFNSGAREYNEGESYSINNDQTSLDRAEGYYNEQAVIGGQSDVAGNFIIVDVNYYDDENNQKNEHLVFDQDGNSVANYD